MKNYLLVALSLLLVSHPVCAKRVAVSDEMVFEEMNLPAVKGAMGETIRYLPDPQEKEFCDQYEEQVRRNFQPTLPERALDLGVATGKLAFNTAWTVGSYAADKVARYTTAYLTSYYGEELLVHGLSKAAGGITTLAAGPAAGIAVEGGINTLYKLSKYVPGLEGATAVLLTPTVKVGTDALINHAPTAVKTVATKSYNALSSAYQWWKGSSK